MVGYTIGYPPGCRRRNLPLVVYLHGYGENHTAGFAGMPLDEALAMHVNGKPLRPMAMVAVDGGNGYWHKHPGDNPMRMVVHELIPMCLRLGLGRGYKRIAVAGLSMGGYGALLLAEKHPKLVAAVAVVSPAVWVTYADVLRANQTAFISAADFARNDVITHAGRLRGIPVYMASGLQDPFHPYIETLAPALAAVGARIDISPGGHAGAFFVEKAPAALAFLASHLNSHRR